MFPCLTCGAEWPSQWAALECEICLPYPCPICGTRYSSKVAADDRCCRD